MYQLLLKKNLFKLTVMTSLANQKKLKSTTLINELAVSRTTLQRVINNLNDDLLCLSSSVQIKQDDLNRFYLENKSKISSMAIFHQLKLAYLKESPHFMVFTRLVTQPSCSIKQIKSEIHFSKSYLYKLIQELNSELAQYKLEILFHKNHSTIEIHGNEITLRTFIFKFLTECYQIIEWPFRTITPQELNQKINQPSLKNLIDLSDSQINQVFFYLAILDIRLKKNQSIQKIKNESISILEILAEDEDSSAYISLFFDKYYLSNDVLRNERLFFNLVIRLLHSSIFTQKQISRGGSILGESDQAFLLDSKKLSDQFILEFGLGQETDVVRELNYHLCLYQLFLSLNKADLNIFSSLYLQQMKKSTVDGRIYEQIELFYSRFIEMEEGSYFKTHGSVEIMCEILFCFHQLHNVPQVWICIQLSNNRAGERLLIQQIEAIFNRTSVKFTRKLSEASIVISDSMEKECKDVVYFYIENIHDREQFVYLTLLIHKMLLIDTNVYFKSILEKITAV